jgi:transcription termination factor NusB
VSLRTKSREFAMQMLFQWDMSKQDFAKLEAKFWKSAKAADKTRAFANQLFEGAATSRCSTRSSSNTLRIGGSNG